MLFRAPLDLTIFTRAISGALGYLKKQTQSRESGILGKIEDEEDLFMGGWETVEPEARILPTQTRKRRVKTGRTWQMGKISTPRTA